MTQPTYDFSSRVALVTGAASGIGLAAARAFASAGAAVSLIDRDARRLDDARRALADEGHRVLATPCDVSDETQAKEAVRRTVAELGGLDMAYNNAGILGPMCELIDEPVEGYDVTQAVNLRGVWTFMKHELIEMKRQGHGSIVNCSSLGGLIGLSGRAAYHASKHGVIGLTKCAALDMAPLGIRVNAICPGCIETPMGDEIEPAAMAEFLKQQPVGRMGRPEEVAAAVLWLCSPASSFVTGVALPVDGGFVAH